METTIEEAPPVKLYPGRAELAKKLAKYKEHDSELQAYRAKAARAEVDETLAAQNEKLSENESAEAISRAQNLKSVFAARIKSREAGLAKALEELKTATGTAEGELRGLVDRELNRRIPILTAKVRELLSIAEDDSTVPIRPLLYRSKLIHDVLRLEPPSTLWTGDTVEHTIGRAEEVLAKLGEIEVAAGREI
jgi:hypothetical protein